MLATVSGFLLLPLLVSIAYVVVWPGVASRPILVGLLSAVSGLVVSAVALYWAALPLSEIGIAGARDSGSSGIGALLTPRLLLAGTIALILCSAAAWLAHRIVLRLS